MLDPTAPRGVISGASDSARRSDNPVSLKALSSIYLDARKDAQYADSTRAVARAESRH